MSQIRGAKTRSQFQSLLYNYCGHIHSYFRLKGFAPRQNLPRQHRPVLLISEYSHKHYKVAEVTPAPRAQPEFKSPQQHHTRHQDRSWGKAIKPSEINQHNIMATTRRELLRLRLGSVCCDSQSLRCHTAKCRGRTAMPNPGILTPYKPSSLLFCSVWWNHHLGHFLCLLICLFC